MDRARSGYIIKSRPMPRFRDEIQPEPLRQLENSNSPASTVWVDGK